MAIILTINKNTYREGINNIGDWVAIKEDDFVPRNGDLGFDIIKVDKSIKELEDEIVKKQVAESITMENVGKYAARTADDYKSITDIKDVPIADIMIANTTSNIVIEPKEVKG